MATTERKFDSGVAPKGRTTEPAAGEVGEYIEAAASSTTSTVSADTDVDAAGMSITLTPGNWLLGYDVSVLLDWVSGTSFGAGRVRITNSSNTAVAGTEAYIQAGLASTADDICMSVSRQKRIHVTTTTTYKIRIACNRVDTTSKLSILPSGIGVFTGDDNHSNIWALRIA